MAIAYDAGTRGSYGAATSHTTAHTCTGTDRFLVVSFCVPHASATCTGVTYAGVSMVSAVDKAMVQYTGRQYIFVLAAPASGANNCVVSLSASVGMDIAINSFTGCNQVSAVDATSTNSSGSSASYSDTVVTVADNCWLYAGIRQDAGDVAAVSNTTGRAGAGTGSGSTSFSTSTAQTPAGSKVMSYSASSYLWDSVAISIAPPSVLTFVPKIIIT